MLTIRLARRGRKKFAFFDLVVAEKTRAVQKKFIAKAYYGIQNKGYGWILTYDKNEKIDQNYFEKKIKEAIDYRKNFFENHKNSVELEEFDEEELYLQGD